MNGSWHLGRLVGIDVRIHWTFLLLPLWIYSSSLAAGSGFVAATMAVVFVLAIFGCVVLHELGHALTARRFGISTRDITLLPIGGVASLQRIPRSPWQELAIAIAGPAVNVVIAAFIFLGVSILTLDGPMSVAVASFLGNLALVNVGLVVFNMLPAFPMDGGRVLRALLALAMPYLKATRTAVVVGQIVAVGLAALSIISGNLMLLFIAGFVFLAGRGEASIVAREDADSFRPRDSLEDAAKHAFTLPLSDLRKLPIVSAQWSAKSALGWLSNNTIDEFLLSSAGNIIGVVRKSELLDAVRSGRGDWAIESLLHSHFVHLHRFQSAG